MAYMHGFNLFWNVIIFIDKYIYTYKEFDQFCSLLIAITFKRKGEELSSIEVWNVRVNFKIEMEELQLHRHIMNENTVNFFVLLK